MNIFKRIWYWNKNTWWYQLKDFKEYNITKLHFDCVAESFNSKPYDYSYLWRVERAHLIEMRSYFKTSNVVDHEEDIRYINICIKLLEILIDDGKGLFDFDNMTFKKHVNIRNDYRFMSDKLRSSYNDMEIYCFDVYLSKVKHLYYEIMKEKVKNWWD